MIMVTILALTPGRGRPRQMGPVCTRACAIRSATAFGVLAQARGVEPETLGACEHQCQGLAPSQLLRNYSTSSHTDLEFLCGRSGGTNIGGAVAGRERLLRGTARPDPRRPRGRDD